MPHSHIPLRYLQQLHSLYSDKTSDKTSVGAPSEGTVVRDVPLELAAEDRDRAHRLVLFIEVLLLLWPLSVVETVSSKSSRQTK